MEVVDEGVRSYRELLRYVLQEYQTRGGKLIYPVGCYHLEDWLLDGLNVPKLLAHLQTEREVSLVKLCEGEAGVQTLKSLTLNNPGPLAQGLNPGNAPQLQSQSSGKNVRGSRESDLHLNLPETGMTEEHLQWLAYTLFVGSCSSYSSETLTDSVREQLQISPSSADSLLKLLGEAANMQSQAASSLEMITVLLQIGRPHYFEDFKAFSSWRQSCVAAVCQSLIIGASEPSNDMRQRDRASLRPDLMRLKMYSRMLEVPSSEEFVEDVYSEGVNLTTKAASIVAKSSGLGWSLPWAIKVKVAELLMASGFTSNSGESLGEQKQLNYVLRHHLWPLLSLPLNLHDCLHAWAYFKIFSVTGNADLLATGRDLMESIPRRNSIMNGTSRKTQDPDSFIDNTIRSIVDWTALRLSSYRQLADAAPIPSLLGLLISCQRYLGLGSHDTAQVLEDCIRASIQTEFERAVQDLREGIEGVPKDGDWIVQVAECCSDLLDEEVSYYSPLFSGVVSRPHEIAAQQVHKCFNDYLVPFLQTVHILDDENLEAIRASVKLESRLQTLLGSNVSSGLDWAILERLTPLLHLWVVNQLNLLDQWYERIWAKEDWTPLNPNGGPARSTPELARIAREMLEALFNLHLGIPEEVVNAACIGLDNLFQRYARDIGLELGTPDFFIPPIPSLTRFKKDVKDKAIALDAKQQRQRLDSGSLQRYLSPGEEHLAKISTDSLLVRANTLEETRRNLAEFSQVLYDRYDTPEGQDGLWAERMFDGTRHALTRSKDIVLKFVAVKVVFQELEKDVSNVYKHSVSEARVNSLVDAINEKLLAMVGLIDEDLRDDLASHFLNALVDSFLRILLHGGSNRFFKPSDVPLIEEDLNELKHLFFQGGDGIPMEEIEAKCKDIDDLLPLLAMNTNDLIYNLKRVRQQEKLGGFQGKQPLELDSSILLPILAHREDHAASKYLKKEYSLPKKLENGGVLPFGTSKTASQNGVTQPKKSKLSFGFKRSAF